MSDEKKSILKTALITDTTDGKQYNPGKMLKRLMERQGVSRKELHKMVNKKHTHFASPCVISDFCNDYHARHIPHKYLEKLISCLGMPKQMTRYYTCEFIKSILDPSLHKYVDAPTRIVKPAIYAATIENLEETVRGLNVQNDFLNQVLSQEKVRSQEYLYQLKLSADAFTDLKERKGMEDITETSLNPQSVKEFDRYIDKLIVENLSQKHETEAIQEIPTYLPNVLNSIASIVINANQHGLMNAIFSGTPLNINFINDVLVGSGAIRGTTRLYTDGDILRFRLSRRVESIMVGFLYTQESHTLENILHHRASFTDFFKAFRVTMVQIISYTGNCYADIMRSSNEALFDTDLTEEQAFNLLKKSYNQYQMSKLKDIKSFEQFMEDTDQPLNSSEGDNLLLAAYAFRKTYAHRVAGRIKKEGGFVADYHDKQISSIDFYNLKTRPEEPGLVEEMQSFLKGAELIPENINSVLNDIFVQIEDHAIYCEHNHLQLLEVEKCNQGDTGALFSYSVEDMVAAYHDLNLDEFKASQDYIWQPSTLNR
jgi:hypothetical protein